MSSELKTFLAELRFAGYQVRTGKAGSTTQYIVSPRAASVGKVAFWLHDKEWVVASRLTLTKGLHKDVYDSFEDAAERIGEVMRDE